ncbi:MAG: hypothetical protein HGB03_03100 [Candidatus Yonathbacteria bacterium]|nr:hypothetical protein [Candidatus Yonathbacteria bacterium]NTW47379.1 hypothetical protein [Candidatus Yonathbacteria bacterium]
MYDKDFGILFWTHLLLIIAVWSSPFWLPWELILIGIILYYLQLLLVGDCILTKWQFKSQRREMTFYAHVLEKLGFQFDRHKVRFTADYIMPGIILGIALLWQLL